VVTRPALDELPAADVIARLLDGQASALDAVRASAAAIELAVPLVRDAVLGGGRLAFAGAGTSGRLAAAEAAELPGTFGLPAARCLPLIAGAADPTVDVIDDSAEDDAAAGASLVESAGLGHADVLIAVAASGRTPFTLAAAEAARARDVPVVAVVNAAGTPLAAVATVAVEAVTVEEVLRGSTRLAAGTAQKVALNTLTTAAMAAAGRVHGDLMIDVVAANAKLRDRAAGIVAEIAQCSVEQAAAALAACDGNARAAAVHLVRGLDPAAARERAARHPSLRAALSG